MSLLATKQLVIVSETSFFPMQRYKVQRILLIASRREKQPINLRCDFNHYML